MVLNHFYPLTKMQVTSSSHNKKRGRKKNVEIKSEKF